MKLINLVIILIVLLIVPASAATIKEIEKCADKLYEYGKIDEVIEVKVKDEVKEVKNGYECGVMIENYSDIKVGDIIETFKEIQTNRKL